MTNFAHTLQNPLPNGLPNPFRGTTSPRMILALVVGVAVWVGVGVWLSPVLAALPLGVALIALVLTLFIRYPRVWLCVGALLNYFWISQGKGDDAITAKEYALIVFLYGGLAIWFFGMLVVQRRRIIRHFGDKLILSALGLSVLNLPIALMQGTPVVTWLREWLLFFMILYYFPWREHFTERRQMYAFFACHAAVFLLIGALNVWQYVKAATNVIYAYQIWASRKMLNTHIFLCATLFTTLGSLYARQWRTKLLFIGLAGFYALVVVVSFSRGFWISGMFAMFVILWLLDKRKLALFLMYSIVAAVLFTVAVQVVFPDKATFIFKVLKARFASSATGTQDVSLLSRYYETKSVLRLLEQYWIGGFGLGSPFYAYDPISKTFYTATFIHNGYLFVWLKLGLAFFLSYFVFWGYMMRRAYRVARAATVPMVKILAAGCVACITAFWLLNITSSISEGRDGFYCLSMCFAALGFSESLEEREKQGYRQE